MENLKKSNELLEAIANGVAFDKETGLIWEHWLNSVTEQVEKNNLELCDGECSHENSGLHKHIVNRRVSGFVAMNKDEYDIENMSFYKTKKKAEKEWGNKQDIVKVKVDFQHGG